MIENAL